MKQIVHLHIRWLFAQKKNLKIGEQEKFFMNGGVPSVEVIREGAGKDQSVKEHPQPEKKTVLPSVAPVGAVQEHRVVREKRDVVITPVEHGFPQADVIDVWFGMCE